MYWKEIGNVSILKATKTAGCEASLFCRYIFMNYSMQTCTEEYICVQKEELRIIKDKK